MENKNRSFFWREVFASLRLSFSRVVTIILSLFIGAMVSAAFLNISLDIEAKLSHELKAYGANFIITPAHKKQFILERDYEKQLSMIPKENLKASVPFLYGFFSLGSNSAIVAGVDFNALKSVYPFIEVRDGYFGASVFDDKSAFLGVTLAKTLELKVGDSVTLTNPKNQESATLTVKGIISSGDEFDGILIAPIKVVQQLTLGNSNEEPYIHFAKAVLYGDYTQVEALGVKISNDEILAKPIAQVSMSEGLILGKIKSLMVLICLVILVVASLSVNTSLSSIIFSRKKEIALHLSLGATKMQVAKLFCAEVLVLALSASILGALCGYFLANLLGWLIFNSTITFRFVSVIIAVLLALFFAFLASYYPIKKALQINITENLKGE